MVVRLIGKVEGQDVIFTRLKGDIWTAEVPAQKSGRYVMELTAFDEAGNIAYCTDVLFSYDATAMKFTIEPLPYINFILGEDKYLKFLVKSTKNEEFEISRATYKLYKDRELETEGNCTINEHCITVKLNPLSKSMRYCLEITYYIADEILKKRVQIEVV